ncbi:double-strand break repair protein AddB [Parvularcula oceani]|uniref:double-strand break repair protein AddB n=1 Tax=Parvularcula oceani TaxID=1247963 RepID=UPI00068F09EB|nr:double-strand break repair protein AddB [Parvularcula oceani]
MTAPLSDLFCDGPALYTIPAGRPFLADLARPLIEAYRDDPLGLADVTIYLPNRRATRALASQFLELGSEAVLLPRLRALGDVDEEDLSIQDAPLSAEEALLPAAEGVERRLVLARLLRAAKEAQGGAVPSWPAALAGADELARLLDDFHTEDVPFSRLGALVTDDAVPQGAMHWQRSLDFLRVVTEAWPGWLAEQGRMEGAARRRALVDALTKSVGAHPPRGPVIVAGSLGTIPATARFMAQVASLPQGLVVLPGLDRELDERAWAQIEPPHPQALFKALLNNSFDGLERGAVEAWPGSPARPEEASRRAFLSLILRPAEATDDWFGRMRQFREHDDLGRATSGLRTAVARNEDEEASFISLLLRETLAEEGKTAILVTPDRTLARRVRMKLGAWGVRVDDSGGTPLGATYRGTFLRAVAHWLCDVSHPVHLCAVLKHQLCGMGRGKAEFAAMLRDLDRALRGLRPGPGWDGLRAALTARWARQVGSEDRLDAVLALIADLEAATAPFEQAASGEALVRALVEVATRLAATPEQEGEERLWRFEDGEALSLHLSQLLAAGPLLPDISRRGFGGFVDTALSGPVVRPRGGTHPRIAILGLLEARLQHADRIILGGLNEGVWPDDARSDPFLSRPMREALGLPSPEMIIGRSAHDFSQLAAAPEVFLTRAERAGRGPAKPSRWMVRFESFLKHTGEEVSSAPRLRTLIARRHGWDKAEPAPRVEPRPPAAARPRRLSISDITTLLRDPYAIYASKVLRLRALDPLDRPVDGGARGTFYHGLFEDYVRAHPERRGSDVPAILQELAGDAFDRQALPPHLRTLWRSQMALAFESFALLEDTVRADHAPAGIEVSGEWRFEVGGEEFILHGRADRIDRRAEDGAALILDYKTGTQVPTVAQAKTFNPQLSLTALMLREGAFADLGPMETYRVAYLESLPKERQTEVFKKNRSLADDELREELALVEERLRDLLCVFCDEATPYLCQPRPFMENSYGQYDHLARRGEWGAAGGEDG